MADTIAHIPVLLHESILGLAVRPGGTYIDGTLGGGGYAVEIIRQMGEKGIFIGLDWDNRALSAAADKICTQYKALKTKHTEDALVLEGKEIQVTLLCRNFADMENVVTELSIPGVDGIALDLGFSSMQLEDGRGLSFLHDDYLDMRLSKNSKGTAADILNQSDEEKLYDIFHVLGEEPLSRIIADAVYRQRRVKPLEKTFELADLVKRIYHARYKGRSKIHPATKVFQALRIAVNDELNNLTNGLKAGEQILCPGGRMGVVSFHSLEDRIVKNFFKNSTISGVTKKPIVPSLEEINRNPRARSAKLRIGEKNHGKT